MLHKFKAKISRLSYRKLNYLLLKRSILFSRRDPGSAKVQRRCGPARTVRRERGQRQVPDHLRVLEAGTGQQGFERVQGTLAKNYAIGHILIVVNGPKLNTYDYLITLN